MSNRVPKQYMLEVWYDVEKLDQLARQTFPSPVDSITRNAHREFAYLKSRWTYYLLFHPRWQLSDEECWFISVLRNRPCFQEFKASITCGLGVPLIIRDEDVPEEQKAVWEDTKQEFVQEMIDQDEKRRNRKRQRWKKQLLRINYLRHGIPWWQGEDCYVPQKQPWPSRWRRVKQWSCWVNGVVKPVPLATCELPVFRLQQLANVLMKCLPADLVWLILSWGW